MKKILLIILLNILFININVHACGEITDLNSNIGTITKINDMNYMVTIPEGTSTITLNANTDYDWVENYGPREVSTNNKVELKVDGKKCGYGIYTYFISFKHVSKPIAENDTEEQTNNIDSAVTDNTNTPAEPEEAPSLKLNLIKIEGYSINFEPIIREYKLNVNSEVESLKIETIPEVDSYTVNISENVNKLVDGENQILISIVNNEGETGTYKIIVNKQKKLSNNNYLASLLIQGYTINFEPAITTYNVTIKNEEILNLNVITETESATYEILGNYNLKNNSVVTIRVKAEDGSTKDYVINIIKKFNIFDYWIYILISALIILLVLLLIIRNNRKKIKKETLPENIIEHTETAGVIPETISQTVTEIVDKQEETILEPVTNGEIQIIEPTNIEIIEKIGTVQEEPTEVFKL